MNICFNPPGFNNPFADNLIRHYLDKVFPGIGGVEVFKLSGGLSGVEVGLVIPTDASESPLVIKFGPPVGDVDVIEKEADNYLSHIKPLLTASTEGYLIDRKVNFTRLLDCNGKALYRKLNSDTNLEESIIGYKFAGGDFLKNCESMLASGNIKESLQRLLQVVTRVLHNQVSASNPDRLRPMKKLVNVPWETFLPRAKQFACCVPGWATFLMTLQERWEKEALQQYPVYTPPKVSCCHNDLRCANLLITPAGNNENEHLHILDYGLTSIGDPVKDLSRIEADLLLRWKGNTDIRHVMQALLDADELCPEIWATDPDILLNLIYMVRQKVKSAFDNGSIRANDFSDYFAYLHYLAGHVTRFARLLDPELEMDPRQLDYMWLALSLLSKILGNPQLDQPVCTSPDGDQLSSAKLNVVVDSPPTSQENMESGTPRFFMVDSLRRNQVIYIQDRPLVVHGRYSGTFSRVWALLKDSYGNHYIQHPIVEFFTNGSWKSMNINPGQGITSILFVEVDGRADSVFQNKVDRADWGGFRSLPTGASILENIPITLPLEQVGPDFINQEDTPADDCIIQVDTELTPYVVGTAPLRLQGSFKGMRRRAWIFLKDEYGHIYLQSPPVDFRPPPDNRWEARNIRPNKGIVSILITTVAEKTNAIINGWAKKKMFGSLELEQLPKGAHIASELNIVVVE